MEDDWQCCFCHKCTKDGIACRNFEEGRCSFRYMPEKSISHFECYIEECVRVSLEKFLNEKD